MNYTNHLTTVVGRIGALGDLVVAEGKKPRLTLRMATEEPDGSTLWFKVILYGPAARIAEKDSKVGQLAKARGHIKVEPYLDKEGQPAAELILKSGFFVSETALLKEMQIRAESTSCDA